MLPNIHTDEFQPLPANSNLAAIPMSYFLPLRLEAEDLRITDKVSHSPSAVVEVAIPEKVRRVTACAKWKVIIIRQSGEIMVSPELNSVAARLTVTRLPLSLVGVCLSEDDESVTPFLPEVEKIV